MQQGQTLNDGLGNQVALFPLDRLHITQGENGSYSHQGSLAIDFIGSSTLYPYYAPVDLKLVSVISAGYVYESKQPVRWVNNLLDHFCLLVAHDDNTSYSVGREVNQGQFLGRTGTTGNVTGDHLHLEVSQGLYTGMEQNSHGVWVLKNQVSMTQLFDIRDTVIVNDYGYSWIEYSGGVVPPSKRKGIPIWLMGSR